jgi:transposase
MVNEGSSLKPTRKGGGRPPKADETTKKLLAEDLSAHPAATVSRRRHLLKHLTGKTLSDSTVRRLLKDMGFSCKERLWRRWNGTTRSS